MRVNPYFGPLLDNVTDLLNRPPLDACDLERRWAAQGMPAQRPATATDVRAVRMFLRQWAQVVDAATAPERVQVLNALLRRHTAPPSITDHDGSGWHLHYRDPDAGFGRMLAGATTAAAAQFLTERGMHRLGRCALDACGAAFVDVSRPGRQRYCGRACANVAAVRRHRARTA